MLCVYIYDVILFFHYVFSQFKKNKENIMGKNLAKLMKEYESFLGTSESQHDFVEKEIEMKEGEEGCVGVKCHL